MQSSGEMLRKTRPHLYRAALCLMALLPMIRGFVPSQQRRAHHSMNGHLLFRNNNNNNARMMRTKEQQTNTRRWHAGRIAKTSPRTITPQHVLFSNIVTDLTLEQANILATPFFILSVVPNAVFCYQLKKLTTTNQCPKGVFVGYLLFLIFGLLAGPAEALAQYLYQVSFFDCDWIHGTVSGLFATGYLTTNLSFLDALQRQPQQQQADNHQHEFPACAFALTTVALLTTFLASQLLALPSVHAPFAFGFLDAPMPLAATAAGAATTLEPVNALSTNCWLNHVLELTQSQMSIRLFYEWAKSQQNQQQQVGWARVASSTLLLQYGSIAVCTFHFFYNDIPILLPLFGSLLLVGSTAVAFAAQKISVGTSDNNNMSLGTAENGADDGMSFDRPRTYFAKTVALALVLSLGIKVFSQQILASSVLREDTTTALSVTVLFSLLATADACRKQATLPKELPLSPSGE